MSPFSTETTAATASRRPCLRLQMAVFLNRRSRDAILPDRHRPMLRNVEAAAIQAGGPSSNAGSRSTSPSVKRQPCGVDHGKDRAAKDVFGLEYRNVMLEPRMSTQEERHDGTNHADDPRPVGL